MSRFKNLLLLLMVALLCLVACQSEEPAEEEAGCAPNCKYTDMVFCYPQLGAESDWRTANTASFKETAGDLGVRLIFSDAQQAPGKPDFRHALLYPARSGCDRPTAGC